ncbi:hypothetical protein BU15DRAFT_79357 [Melanogaster broomeanus]|nr:hypothetical protein BU15DRAFT_79357 [Melanogaster broomeanus]
MPRRCTQSRHLLPVTQNAPALAFMWFLRSFAGVWGVTIGSTVLQNELVKRLPSDFTSTIPGGGAGLAYALIPELPLLPPQLLTQGSGFLCSLPMKGLPLTNSLDEQWALKKEAKTNASSMNLYSEQA